MSTATSAGPANGQRTGTTVEDTGLTTRQDVGRELAPSHGEATARYEMESAIIVAKRFPRNEDKAFEALTKSCGRLSFAQDATYSFPRGDQTIEGPSVYLAKEGARVWGNIRYGADIISDDENNRHVRGWAWDMETNTKATADDAFAKLIYRKKGGWQKPDERDLRELTNRRAAILIRNCIISLLPSDLVDDAIRQAKQTLEKGVASNIDESRKSCIKAFSSIGVTVEDLESYLGHKVGQCSPKEIADLRTVYKSIIDGNSKWVDYVVDKPTAAATTGQVSAADLTKPQSATDAASTGTDPGPTQTPADEPQSALTRTADGSPAGAVSTLPLTDSLEGLGDELAECAKLGDVNAVEQEWLARVVESLRDAVRTSCQQRRDHIKSRK